MNTKEWAAKLNNRRYTEEMSREEESQAKADGMIIVFGASDDLIEFRGLMYDEAGAWEGATVRLTPDFAVFDHDDNMETFKYNAAEIAQMPSVTAVWCPENEQGEVWASWMYKTDIPHEKFAIFEDDGEVYCHGIVFDGRHVGAVEQAFATDQNPPRENSVAE